LVISPLSSGLCGHGFLFGLGLALVTEFFEFCLVREPTDAAPSLVSSMRCTLSRGRGTLLSTGLAPGWSELSQVVAVVVMSYRVSRMSSAGGGVFFATAGEEEEHPIREPGTE
jgi:hypothetical protein